MKCSLISLGFSPCIPNIPQLRIIRTVRCFNARENKQDPVELPGDVLWWLNVNRDASSCANESALVPRDPSSHSLVLRPHQATDMVSLAGMMVIDTDFEITSDDTIAAEHPRRTRRLLFTCNLCGQSNSKRVNPIAWERGSVFARCDGCDVVHKLKDNLKVMWCVCIIFSFLHFRGEWNHLLLFVIDVYTWCIFLHCRYSMSCKALSFRQSIFETLFWSKNALIKLLKLGKETAWARNVRYRCHGKHWSAFCMGITNKDDCIILMYYWMRSKLANSYSKKGIWLCG